MSLGANLSSGYTDKLIQSATQCGITGNVNSILPNTCCAVSSGPVKDVQIPSMLLLSKVCPPPTAEEFALYPKIAQPCSVYIQALSTPDSRCASLPNPNTRFAQYNRFQPAAPCQALPQSANMAGISQPSTRLCNSNFQ
jgi:hypothetical protein